MLHSDHQPRPARHRQAHDRQDDRRHQLEAVQPHQFGILRQIRDLGQVGRLVPGREDPADVAVQEALVARRMDVAPGVGMEVVVAVLRSPPQHALLGAALGDERQDELERSAGRIGLVRKQPVIARADGEDAQPIEADTQRHGLPGDARPDRREAGQVYQDERKRRGIDDVVVFGIDVGVGGQAVLRCFAAH